MHHVTLIEVVLVLIVTVFATTGTVGALPRLLDRSLKIGTSEPGVVTTYEISFTFRSAPTVGSVDLLACMNPIPYMACEAPTGMDFSQAVLVAQTGETGWTVVQRSANHLLLSRPPAAVGETPSKLTFANVKNPIRSDRSFAIRMADYAAQDATGPVLNPGSVMSQVQKGISFETQVPPILIFCLGEQVTADCSVMSSNHYSDMGDLDPRTTLRASSQMGVGTNASQGFAITINGSTMSSGTNIIEPMKSPIPSVVGTSQFGINLRANTAPEIGQDPDGDSANANPTAPYSIPDHYMFKDGDVVASSPNVSLIRRFTTSYIANSPADLRAGVYSTTLTYICSGRF